jgi:hypothetical protein
MGPTDWLDGIEVTISNCDEAGVTRYFNARAAKAFAPQGGYDLLGRAMQDCHPAGPALEKFEALLASQKLNAYTIEKAGQKKLIYQVPVFESGIFRGFTELALPLPEGPLPHFVRQG